MLEPIEMPVPNVAFVRSRQSRDYRDVFAQIKHFPCYIFLPPPVKTLFYMEKDKTPLAIPIDEKQYDRIIKELSLADLQVKADTNETGRAGRPLKTTQNHDRLKAIITGRTNIEQSKVIPALDKYLKSIDVQLTSDPEGMCNGLSAVYCKYVLENREDEYFSMLRKLVNQSDSGNINRDPELSQFVQEVFYAFDPDAFTKGINQNRAAEQLKVTNPESPSQPQQNIKKIFQFSASTTPDQWAATFDKLKIDGAVYSINSKNHMISAKVFRDETGSLKFRVYNPNYVDGFKDFPDAKSLTAELVKKFGTNDDGSFGMTIGALENPYKPMAKHLFPNKEDLINPILGTASASSIQETLAFAAQANDYEIIDIILRRGEEKGEEKGIVPGPSALGSAIVNNSIESLEIILQKYKFSDTAEDYYGCAEAALSRGNKETVKFLFKRLPGFEEQLQNLPLERKIKLLEIAAASHNPSSVQKALALFGKEDIAERIMSSMVIDNAIASGNTEVLELILARSPLKYTSQAEGFLEVAVEANNLNMVNYFSIKQPRAVAKFEITPELIKEKNPLIIDKLIESGAKLQEASREVYLEQRSPGAKEHQQRIFRDVNLVAGSLKSDSANTGLINKKLSDVICPLILQGNFSEAQVEVNKLKKELAPAPSKFGRKSEATEAIKTVDAIEEILVKAEMQRLSTFKQRFQGVMQEVKPQPKDEVATAPAVTFHMGTGTD